MYRVRFAELGIKDESLLKVAENVLKSGEFIGGHVVDMFADEWAACCNTKYCVPTSSGSAALTTTLNLLFDKGSFVLVPAMSFAATVFSVVHAGLIPVYVDVLPNGLMNLDKAREAAGKFDVAGIIPVHLYGQWQRIPSDLLDNYIVVEDACQVHGGFMSLQGAAACFSFYPSKNLGGAGDSGAVVTNKKWLAERIYRYNNYGDPKGEKYRHTVVGVNERMDAIQAAILSYKLSSLEASNEARAHVADMYESFGVTSIACGTCVWHLYPILVSEPAVFAKKFDEVGIDVGRHYPYVLSDIVDGTIYGDVEVARNIARHVLTLPIGPHLDTDDVIRVVNELKSFAVFEDNIWRLR